MHIKSIGIIGLGDFGSFLVVLAKKHFPELGIKVFSSSREPDDTTFFSLEDVCTTDLVFVCVPISAFEDTIARMLPHLGSDTIVCDVATVKMHTVSLLKRMKVSHFISTHPMFGPYSYAKQGDSLQDLRLVITDSSLPQDQLRQAITILEGLGLKILEITSEEHDRLVAETLFLTHLVGQTVTHGNFKRTSIDTVSFGFLMDAVESVANDEALFRDVYTYNPFCKDVLSRFERAEKKISSLLESK